MAHEIMNSTQNQYDHLKFRNQPFRRGPMYSVYSELREWKLRIKNNKIPTTPPPSRSANSTPMVSRSVQEPLMNFRKENKKPLSTPKQHAPTALDSTPKHEMKRAMSITRGSRDGIETKSCVFSARKSYDCFKEKNIGSVRRQRQAVSSSMNMSWMC